MKIKNTFILLLFGVAVFGYHSSSAVEINYSVIELFQIDNAANLPLGGIADNGDILGRQGNSDTFVYESSTQSLKSTPGTDSGDLRIGMRSNGSGYAVAYNSDKSYIYQGGNWQELNLPGGNLGYLSATSNSEFLLRFDRLNNLETENSFLFPNDFFVAFNPQQMSNPVNGTPIVIGQYKTWKIDDEGSIYTPIYPAFWEADYYTVIVENSLSFANAISDSGQFIVGVHNTNEGFLYDRISDSLQIFSSPVLGVNDNGYAFTDTSIINPNGDIIPISFDSEWAIENIALGGINNLNQLVGAIDLDNDTWKVVMLDPVSVPEPSHFAALGGLIVLLVILRKRT